MTLEQIITFMEVYHQSSFQKAAEILFLPQSTVSNRVIQLEKELGCSLLTRGKKSIKLTVEGKAFYPHAEQIIESIQSAKQAVEHIRSGEKEKLFIGCSNALSLSLLPELMHSFIEEFPEMSVCIYNKSSKIQFKMLKQQEIQLGITRYVSNDPLLSFTKIYSEPAMLILSPEHHLASQREVSVSEILREPLIVSQKNTYKRKTLDTALERLNLKCEFKFETNNLPFIVDMVQFNQGVYLSAPSMLKKELDSGAIRAIPIRENPFPPSDIFLAHRTDYMSSLGRLFSQHLKHQLHFLSAANQQHHA